MHHSALLKTRVTGKRILVLAACLLATAGTAHAQNIYKCTRDGRVEFTDHPCPGHQGKLIHQADASEIIDQYLRLGQDTLAQRYAQAHHLEALYQARVAAYQQAQDAEAQRQADRQAAAAEAAKQRAEQAQQQARAEDAARRARLEAENDVLREQNDQYRDRLAQPVYTAPPLYWGVRPDYGRYPGDHGHWGDHHGHDRGHDHDAPRPRPPHALPPAKDPVVHPCKQLAGGRVQC